MTAEAHIRKLRDRRRVPLRVGDQWVYVGPRTVVRIVGLSPRPTTQKPWAQLVTLDDGRSITEATLRSAYMRREEYGKFCRSLSVKWEQCKAEFFGEPAPTAKVLPFLRRKL